MKAVPKLELTNCPQWLLDAKTTDELVRFDAVGMLVWEDGSFEDGSFLGGYFRGGSFRGGSFLGGYFLGGYFLGGSFLGGYFRGGSFLGGKIIGKDGEDHQLERAGKIVALFASVEGSPKHLVDVAGEAWIKAGCRFFPFAAAERYWRDREDRTLTYALLAGARALAEAKGLKIGAAQ